MNTMTKFVRAPVIAQHFGKSTSWARRLGKDAGAEVKYTATEGGNQMEMNTREIVIPNAAAKLLATDFIMVNDEPRRILQHAPTGTVKLIKEDYFKLATTGEQSTLESKVEGPLWMDDGSMYFFSYTTILRVYEMSTKKHAKIMQGLQSMELYKDEREE